eukprot:3089600-Rhodomonas_salina.1
MRVSALHNVQMASFVLQKEGRMHCQCVPVDLGAVTTHNLPASTPCLLLLHQHHKMPAPARKCTAVVPTH